MEKYTDLSKLHQNTPNTTPKANQHKKSILYVEQTGGQSDCTSQSSQYVVRMESLPKLSKLQQSKAKTSLTYPTRSTQRRKSCLLLNKICPGIQHEVNSGNPSELAGRMRSLSKFVNAKRRLGNNIETITNVPRAKHAVQNTDTLWKDLRNERKLVDIYECQDSTRTTEIKSNANEKQQLRTNSVPILEMGVSKQTPNNLEARALVARSLYKLTFNNSSAVAIIQSGAIRKIAEISDFPDAKIQQYSSGILANLTADVTAHESFVKNDGLATLLQLLWSPYIEVKALCLKALCRLTYTRQYAYALARECKASSEFLSVLTLSTSGINLQSKNLFISGSNTSHKHAMTIQYDHMRMLCVQCLMNLLYYGYDIPPIDDFNVGDPVVLKDHRGILMVLQQLILGKLPNTEDDITPSKSSTKRKNLSNLGFTLKDYRKVLFVSRALYNLSLLKECSHGVMLFSGPEILFMLATKWTILQELITHNNNTSAYSSRSQLSLSSSSEAESQSDTNEENMNISEDAMIEILLLIVTSLSNLSEYSEHQASLGFYGIRTIMRLIGKSVTENSSESISTGINDSCIERAAFAAISRVLANLSSNQIVQETIVTLPLVKLIGRLVCSVPHDSIEYAQLIRAIMNLSFHDSCISYLMENNDFVSILQQAITRDNIVEELRFTDHDIKLDSLIAIHNITRLVPYTTSVVEVLDVKSIILIADHKSISPYLKRYYALVLCHFILECEYNCLPVLDIVVKLLIEGFFITANNHHIHSSSQVNNEWLPPPPLKPQENSTAENDEVIFLSALRAIINHINECKNIAHVMDVIVHCLKRPICSNTFERTAKWHLSQENQKICYWASALFYILTTNIINEKITQTTEYDGEKFSLLWNRDIENLLVSLCNKASASLEGVNNDKPVDTLEMGDVDSMVNSEEVMQSSLDNHETNLNSYFLAAQTFCVLSIYHICSLGILESQLIQGVVDACFVKAGFHELSLACAATCAVISFTIEGRQKLVDIQNIAYALNGLCRSPMIKCQIYAAIAACNVASVRCVWNSSDIKDLIMLALLRVNSTRVKLLHARILSNILAQDSCTDQTVNDEILDALMKLSQQIPSGADKSQRKFPISCKVYTCESRSLPTSTIGRPFLKQDMQYNDHQWLNQGDKEKQMQEELAGWSPLGGMFAISLQAIYNLTFDMINHSKLISNRVLLYLAIGNSTSNPILSEDKNNVESVSLHPDITPITPDVRSQSKLLTLGSEIATTLPQAYDTTSFCSQSRRTAIVILSKLSANPDNHYQMLRLQLVDIILQYTHEYNEETQMHGALIIANVSSNSLFLEQLCDKKTLSMLQVFAKSHNAITRCFAMHAFANCSNIFETLHLFLELSIPDCIHNVLKLKSESKTIYTIATTMPTEDQQLKPTMIASLHCLYNMIRDEALCTVIVKNRTVFVIDKIFRNHETARDNVIACYMITKLLSALSNYLQSSEDLLNQGAIHLCETAYSRHKTNADIVLASVEVLTKLSSYRFLHAHLICSQAISIAIDACSVTLSIETNTIIREFTAILMRNLTIGGIEDIFLSERNVEDIDEIEECSIGDFLQNSPEMDITSYNSDDKSTEWSHKQVAYRNFLLCIQHFKQELDNMLSASCQPEAKTTAGVEKHDLDSDVCKSGYESWYTNQTIHEIIVSIANLSKTSIFRIAMINIGLMETLIQLLSIESKNGKVNDQQKFLRNICLVTMHTLAMENLISVDTQTQLFPKLISLVDVSDSEIVQMKYECDKISLLSYPDRAGKLSFHESLHPDSALGGDNESGIFNTLSLQNAFNFLYKEPTWKVFVLQTEISIDSLIPHKRSPKLQSIGCPQLAVRHTLSSLPSIPAACEQSTENLLQSDITSETTSVTSSTVNIDGNLAKSIRKAQMKCKKGFLLDLDMTKHTSFDLEARPSPMMEFLPMVSEDNFVTEHDPRQSSKKSLNQ